MGDLLILTGLMFSIASLFLFNTAVYLGDWCTGCNVPILLLIVSIGINSAGIILISLGY